MHMHTDQDIVDATGLMLHYNNNLLWVKLQHQNVLHVCYYVYMGEIKCSSFRYPLNYNTDLYSMIIDLLLSQAKLIHSTY